MAYFAKIHSSNNVVSAVISVANQNCLDENNQENENVGIAHIQSVTDNEEGYYWKQTSFNHRIRKHFAGIGLTYDSNRDAFLLPKPFASWILNEDTCNWGPPVPEPEESTVMRPYQWNEETQTWDAPQ